MSALLFSVEAKVAQEAHYIWQSLSPCSNAPRPKSTPISQLSVTITIFILLFTIISFSFNWHSSDVQCKLC